MAKKIIKSLPKNKKSSAITIKEYTEVFSEIKKQIQEAQVRSILSVNKELIKFYWWFGKTIKQKQENDGWGTSTIEQLAADLQKEFPGMAGFSRSNIFNIRAFYLAYEKVQQPAGLFKKL